MSPNLSRPDSSKIMHITKDRLMHAIKKYVIHGLARYYRASRVLLYFEKGRVGQAQRLLSTLPFPLSC